MSIPESARELLPCPFCYGAHVTDRHVRDGRQMFCQNCGASVAPTYHGPNNDTLARATAAWNTRTRLAPDSAPAEGEAVAWLHTLHMEFGQTSERCSSSKDNPWGEPGKDYSAEYRVTSEPLGRLDTSAPADVGELIERLNERAVSYDAGGPSSSHTADMLLEAADALARLSRAAPGEEDPYQELHLYEGDSALVIREHGNKTLYGVQLPELLAHFGGAAPAGDEVVAWRAADGSRTKPTVDELQAILDHDDGSTVSINPDGTVTVTPPALSSAKAEIAELRAVIEGGNWGDKWRKRAESAEQALEAAAAERDTFERLYRDGEIAHDNELDTAAAEKRVLLDALAAYDKLSLVIASAVGNYDTDNLDQVVAAVNAGRAALAAGEPRPITGAVRIEPLDTAISEETKQALAEIDKATRTAP